MPWIESWAVARECTMRNAMRIKQLPKNGAQLMLMQSVTNSGIGMTRWGGSRFGSRAMEGDTAGDSRGASDADATNNVQIHVLVQCLQKDLENLI